MTSLRHFSVTYDRDADVLYISTPNRPATQGREDKPGVVWRYDGNGNVVGVTIIDFAHYWYPKRAALAADLSDKLHIPKQQVQNVLEHATTDD